MRFLLLFLFLFSTFGSSESQNHLCEQVEIIFVIDSSQATNETFYNNDLKNFVKSISNAFSFVDDVEHGSQDHARFAIASYGDTYHFKFEFLRDETRQGWSSIVDRHMVYKNFGLGVATNGLDIAEQILTIGSKDMNKVVILATSIVTQNDVDDTMTRYIHDLVPVIFGVGFPNISGVNSVAQDNTNMIKIAQNRQDWVYNTIDDALKAKTGITSKIVEAYPCGTVQCSGFIFAVEDTFQSNSSIKNFISSINKSLDSLPKTNNGFQLLVVDDSQLELFPFEPAPGLVDRMNNFWFEPVFTPEAPRLDMLFRDIRSVINQKEFKNYGVVILAETDYIHSQSSTQTEAGRLADTGAQIFVIDISINPQDGGAIFNAVTKNQADHIIKGAGLNADQLFAEMQKTLIPTLSGFSC